MRWKSLSMMVVARVSDRPLKVLSVEEKEWERVAVLLPSMMRSSTALIVMVWACHQLACEKVMELVVPALLMEI